MVWAGRYPGLAFVRCGTEEQLCKARPDKSLYGEKTDYGLAVFGRFMRHPYPLK